MEHREASDLARSMELLRTAERNQRLCLALLEVTHDEADDIVSDVRGWLSEYHRQDIREVCRTCDGEGYQWRTVPFSDGRTRLVRCEYCTTTPGLLTLNEVERSCRYCGSTDIDEIEKDGYGFWVCADGECGLEAAYDDHCQGQLDALRKEDAA